MADKIQRSFTAGEISPSLQSRADMTKYVNGLNLCENFFIRAQGGVYSRPGFKFIGEIDDHTRVARLIPFSFNTEQTYILVFEHLKIRVIKDGGYVLSGVSVYELATPYTESELSRLNYTQSADVMTIVHPDHDARNLSRLVDDNWSLDVIDYSAPIKPVFNTPASASLPISAITQGNPAMVTVSGAFNFGSGGSVYIDGVVGMTEINGQVSTVTTDGISTVWLTDIDSTNYTAYTSGGNVNHDRVRAIGTGAGTYNKRYEYVVSKVDVYGVESLASDPVSIDTPSLSQTAGVLLSWSPVSGAEYYRVYKNVSTNSGVFGWIGDSKTTSFSDFNIAPITSDAPPEAREPFSGTSDNPSVVEYYQQRQVYANTTNEPQTVFTTQTGNYKSLRTSNPARDDDAVTFTIAARQVNEIRHLVPLDSLIILTSGGEWIVTEGQDKVLTPSTHGVKIQSYNGASWVKPVVVNSTVLYLQEKGAKLRDLGYEFSSDKYTGNDLSIMSEHLVEDNTIVDMAYADEPYGIVWCVRDDGQLLGLTYQREHQVWGWHHHVTDGEFESVATISEDGRDALYAIVKRTINGATKRYVERLEKRLDNASEDCFFIDSGLSYDGSPATVFTGLDHLEGKDVAILADGYVVDGKTVASGSVTLDRAASKVHIGLPYTPAIETLDIDVTSATETVKAQSVSVSKVFIEVERTRGGFVGPRQDEDTNQTVTFQEIRPRYEFDGYDVIQLKTYKQEVIVNPQWSKGGGLRIEQRAPLPMSILSVIPDVDVGGN